MVGADLVVGDHGSVTQSGLSLQLALAGRRKEALAYAREAVDIRRSLARPGNDDDLPGLANARPGSGS